MILSCRDISKAYGTDVILEKITFGIEDKEKIGIVGVNGAGKTTLFKILIGETSYDGGELYIKKEASVGYLQQDVTVESEKTIYEEALTVFEPLLKTEEMMREAEVKMALLEGEELEEHMKYYADLQHEFDQMEGYGYKSRIKGVLKGLGFGEEDFEKPVNTLSGGQKTRVYLSRLLLSKPDILLLDEPTNHLDIESIAWLEDFLKGYNGAVIIISHDRYFLDKIITKTVEIENKKSYVYEGNYSFYAKQKKINRDVQQHQFEQQQREIKRQEEVIKTLRSFNREKSIKRAESREKALQKIERIDKPESFPDKMRLTLTPKILSGNDVLHGEELSKSYGERHLFSNAFIDVKREEKVAIVGPNGVGKSTFLKILLKKVLPDSGFFRLGSNVNIGYYDQEQQNFDESKTVFQEISDAYPNMTNGEVRNVLAAFVFTGDDVFKPISALSGGEKGRLSLAKIMLSKANFLILDEPTNHLDMLSKEILENAINSYEGTVLYVSHDRYFINKTATTVLELTPDGFVKYMGNYDYYIEKKTLKEREEMLFGTKEENENTSSETNDVKADWQSRKEQQAEERKIKNKIAKTEREIEEAENKIVALEEELSKPEVATDAVKATEIFEEKTKIEEHLEELMNRWEELQTE